MGILPIPLPWGRGPVIDPKSGEPTPMFKRWMQDHETMVRSVLSIAGPTQAGLGAAGQIQAAAPIAGRTEGVGTTVTHIDAGGVILAAGIDFTRAYLNKNLDNVPNGTRAAWDTVTQKTAAVDSGGNLLLKNKTQATGSTAGPTTTSGSYVVIPEMTLTITTKGNPVFITFTGVFNFSAFSAGPVMQSAIFKDGVALTTDFQSALSGAQSLNTIITLTWLDPTPTAASHTYDVRWKLVAGGGNTLQASGTERQIEVVELG